MSVSANNEKPQPAVPKGSQKPGPEGWIRPAQKRNNKSFKIRPLLNPPSYAELGCALPAPTQKQRDFLKSHCLSKPAYSIDVYLTFTHSLLSQWDHLLSQEHFPVIMWTRDQNCTWHIDALKQFGIFFSSFALSVVLQYQNLCHGTPLAAREMWKGGPSPRACLILLQLLSKELPCHGPLPDAKLRTCVLSLWTPLACEIGDRKVSPTSCPDAVM